MYGSIPKGKCGGVFILLYLFKEKKNQKQKEGINSSKKKKIEKKERKKMSEREMSKIELFLVFNFSERLEENKKVVSGIA